MAARSRATTSIVSVNDLTGTGPPGRSAPAERRAGARLGEADFVVLGHVAMHPDGVHGYHLARIIARSSPGSPPPALGKLYRLLRRLERAGLVVGRVDPVSNRLRTYFSVTPRGEAEFQRWLAGAPATPASEKTQPFSEERLLRRLRFAERVPRRVLVAWLDEASQACEDEGRALEGLTGSAGEGGRMYMEALRARCSARRRWVDGLRRIVMATATRKAVGE